MEKAQYKSCAGVVRAATVRERGRLSPPSRLRLRWTDHSLFSPLHGPSAETMIHWAASMRSCACAAVSRPEFLKSVTLLMKAFILLTPAVVLPALNLFIASL